MRRFLLAITFLALVVAGHDSRLAAAPDVLVPLGADWRYLDDGSNQQTAWRTPSFNDAAWPVGLAQLGYGDGDERTIVNYGPNSSNKYITTYFRHTFTVADPTVLGPLTLRLLRDDGAVVYLNGAEVFRSNMPAGTVAHTTPASVAVGGADELAFYSTTVAASLLVPGSNVVAVELHQSGGTSSDLSFDLELTTTAGLTLTRGPYLQLGTPTSTIVRWRTSTPVDSVVRYGTAPASLTSTRSLAGTRTEHEVTLTGLAPATRYHYAVGSSTTTLAGDATFTFKTAPTPGSEVPTRVWVLGDSGRANAGQAAVRDAYRTFTAGRDTDLWLMLGDNAYVDGTDVEYQRGVFEMYPEMLRQAVLWPTLGNHDGHTADSATQTGGYYDIFTLPRAAEAGGTASGTEAYYSFDYGNIHFVCLESYETDRSPSGAMASWLRADLAATTARWVVAYWHHPPYSKGSHNSDTEIELVQMRENLLPVLEAGGVDLVLAGHSHSYERSMLIDGHYGLSTTLTSAMKIDAGSGREADGMPYRKPGSIPVPHQGTVYAVAGTSALASGGTLNHPAMFVSLNVLGSLVLDVNGARLDARFVDDTGAVRDQFTILKDAAAPMPPEVPQSLSATATAPTAVDLSWTDASSNEAGFRIQRSLDGNTFTEIAQVGPNVTTYGDGSASPDTTIRYRVHAYNAAGPSPHSNTATVTTPALPPPPPPPPFNSLLVPLGATWRYLDNGSNQGTAWRAGSFADSTWKLGQAQFGYGDGDERTLVSYGPSTTNRYITTYFRHAFTVGDRAAVATLSLRLLRDDGAIVYLNGVEAFRSNMPSGTVSYTTLASAAVGGTDEQRFYTAALSTASLLTGTNVIAVELHQSSGSSSDLSLDLDLTATERPSTPPPAPGNLAATATSPTTVALSWSDTGTTEDGVYIERSPDGVNFAQIGALAANTTSYTSGSLQSGITYWYRVRAYNAVGPSAYSNIANATTPMPPVDEVLVPAGATWRYLDNGSNQGTAWRAAGFNHQTWKTGAAELGYGDGGERTVVGYGPSSSNRYITTYFRQSFTIGNPSYLSATLRLLRDDGAVVYVNGVEVFRSNMPSGSIGYRTLATSAVSGADESRFYETSINPARFVTGTNVIAVELHQSSSSSSDISFDLQLLARR